MASGENDVAPTSNFIDDGGIVLTLYLLVFLLINFANNLDPDQARQNVGSDLDPNC